MKRSPVQSSNVAAIGYDPYTETLEVEFRPNRAGTASIWRYSPVPRGMFADLFGDGKSAGAAVGGLRMNPDVRSLHVDDIEAAPQEEPSVDEAQNEAAPESDDEDDEDDA